MAVRCSDIWFGSRIQPDAEILVRITYYQEADGLPRQELNLIGAVYQDLGRGGYAARVGDQERLGCNKRQAKQYIKNFVEQKGI